MRKPSGNRAVAFAALVTVLLIVATAGPGCSGRKREPVFADPTLAQRELSPLQIMPIVDTRPDPFDAVTVSNQFRSASKRVLEHKGYEVSIEPVSSAERSISAGDIAKMGVRELAELAPPNQQYLLYLWIDHLERGYDTRGERSRVRVRGVIIDAAQKTKITLLRTNIASRDMNDSMRASERSACHRLAMRIPAKSAIAIM